MDFKRLITLTTFVLLVNSFLFSQISEKREINELIQKKRSFNKENKNTSALIIQLYNGNEQEAYIIKNKFQDIFENYEVKVVYKSPEWKTQVVYFYTRLEADYVLNKIKKEFDSAIVLEEKI